MDFVLKKENDVEYLKTVIAQREIVIEERVREKTVLQKQCKSLSQKVLTLEETLSSQRTKFSQQTTNLNLALKEMQHQVEQMRNEKNEFEFQLNVAKMKIQELNKEHVKQANRLKNQFESQKQALNQKISKLQKNLTTLNNHYHIQQAISEDKQKIIEDANRNLRGFANQKQQRMIIIKNQQLTNQIQFQSRQITNLLQKSEKLQEQIKQLKMDLQLHRNIENDLVKRSSLAQNLIKQLNNRVRELENKLEEKQRDYSSQNSIKESKVSERRANQSEHQSRASDFSRESKKQIQESLAKLKFENASLKNYNHYLQTQYKNNNKKYENLAEIMAQYLEVLLFSNKSENLSQEHHLSIDINSLKARDIKQWQPMQTEVVLNLLITQIKPYLSKSSLVNFPQPKNIKVSFVEEQNKDPVSLPRIVEDYQKNQATQMSKKGNRFKDIPVDISTKILRSNLREWGAKISYGSHIPRNRRQVSKSIVIENEKHVI